MLRSRNTERARKWIGTAGIVLLVSALWSSARVGLSRLYSEYGLAANSVEAAETAIRINAADPQAHYARAGTLADANRYEEATVAFEHAIRLRPSDYYFWLKLGRARDWLGDEAGARSALLTAVRLAPFYAAPRWELGNLLLRAGELDASFVELRRAAESNALLLPAVIDLVWNACDGDAGRVRRTIDPRTPEAQLALARYFAQRDRLPETIELLDAAGNEAAATQRRTLSRALLDQHRFHEAHQVWLSGVAGRQGNNDALLSDGGFEGRLARAPEADFGWQWSEEAQSAVTLALDPNSPHAGARSLRLNWAGDLHPAIPILSQLTIVQPNRHYRLTFAARTEELVSGGLPLIAVADALDKDSAPLGQSEVLPQRTNGWRDYAVAFTARDTTTAVIILLRRQCATAPCPIYGRVWLDDFSLKQTDSE